MDLLTQLQEKLEYVLDENDILVVDTRLFIPNNGKTYTDVEELRHDVAFSKAAAYFRVTALFGDNVWDFMEEDDHENEHCQGEGSGNRKHLGPGPEE